MRNKFIELLIESNKKTNIKRYLIVGDVGFSVIEKFQNSYPDYFLNVGVAEQNLTSIAAGIASEGHQSFTYSIANFPTFRCAEQIRNTIDYHNLNVTIVSIGGGLEYGSLGYSHHAIQDYGLIRLFPNFIILSPSDDEELEQCFDFCLKYNGPKYLRLSKYKSKNVIKKKINKNINLIKESKKYPKKAILTTGKIINDVMTNNNLVNLYNIYSCPIWGENEKKNISKFISKFDKLIVIEDHLYSSGFGSYILECIEENQLSTKVKKIALSNNVIGKVGNDINLKKKYLKFEID